MEFLLVLVILLTCMLQTSWSFSFKYDKTTSDMFSAYLIQDFGVAKGGSLQFDYKIQAKNEQLSYKSFILIITVTEAARVGWYSNLMTVSGENANYYQAIGDICHQPSEGRNVLYGVGTYQYKVKQTDRYSVIIVQCFESYEDNPITVSLNGFLRNPSTTGEDDGSMLPIQDIPYINMTLGLTLLYIILIVSLAGQLLLADSTSRRPIHYLFLLTLALGVAANASYYGFLMHVDVTGFTHDGYIIAAQIFEHLFSAAFITSLLLLSLGWTVTRNFLSDKEKQFAAVTVISYIIIGIASATCLGGTDSTSSCKALGVLMYVLRSIILLGVVVGMNFSITQLRTIIMHLPWVHGILMQYARVKQYSTFRIAFLLYLLLPTMILLMQVSLLSWESYWITDLLIELLDVGLILCVGITFAPISEQFLSRAFDGSIEQMREE